MADFGTIKGQITLDVKQALASYTKLRLQHLNTVTALHTGAGALQASGAAMAGAGAVMAGAFVGAIGKAAEFEKRLDAFGAVSNSTTGDMEKVRAKALQLGKDTVYSANDIADAFIELGKQGRSASDIVNGLGDATAALASAGDLPLAQSAEILSNTLTTYGLKAQDAVKVSDRLAGAANASSVDVQDLGVSFKYVAGIAASLGVSFQDTNTALGVLGNYGIKGSTAGTSLRQVLVALSGPTKKSAGELMDLGIIAKDGSNAFYDATGKLKPLPDVLDTLSKSLEGMNAKEKYDALSRIFPIRAMPTILNLLKSGKTGFEDMAKAIDRSSAADVASKRLDNLSGDIEILKGNIETMAIDAGSGFQQLARGVVQGITNILGAFSGLSQGAQTGILGFIGVMGGILLVVGGLGMFAGAILNIVALAIQLKDAIVAIRAVMAAWRTALLATSAAQWILNSAILANPLTWIIVAIIAVVAALIWFFTQTKIGRQIWAGFVSWLQSAWTNISNFAVSVWTAVANFFVGLWNGISSTATSVWSSIVNFFTTIWSGVASFFSGLWQGIQSTVTSVWNGIVAFFTTVWNAIVQGFLNFTLPGLIISHFGQIKAFIVAVWNSIVAFFAGVFTAIMTVAQPFIDFWMAHVAPMFQAFGALVAAIFNFIWQTIVFVWQSIVAFVVPIVTAMVTAIIAYFTMVWNGIVIAMTAIWTVIMTVWNAIVGFLMAVVGAVIAFLVGQFNFWSALVSSVMNAIWGVISSVWNAIVGFIMGVVGAIVAFVTSSWNRMMSVVSTIMNAIRSVVSSVWNAIFSVVSSIVNRVRNFISSGWNALVGLVGGIFGRVTSAIKEKLNAAIQFISGIKDRIMGFFAGAGSWLINAGRQIIQGLANGIGQMFDAVTSKLKSLTNLIPKVKGPENVDKVLLTPAGVLIMQGFMRGIDSMVPALRNQLGGISNDLPGMFGNPDLGNLAASITATRDMAITASTPAIDPMQTAIDTLTDKIEGFMEEPRSVNLEVTNPAPERASDSLPKSLRQVSSMI